MPDLTPTRWSPAQTRAQFFAIARLRWRITANSLRRKGGKGELLASLLIYPLLAILAVLPTLAVGGFAYYFAANDQLGHIYWLCWATFGLCQLLNIQLGQASTTFDPTQLIRFPMHVRTYTAIRLFFGMLSPANIVGTLMCFAIALGVSIAQPALWLYAFLALAVFAAANILFTRMVFAWVDRWLATRRAREVFTAIIFLFVMGIQYVNFTFNPAYNHGNKPRHHFTALLPYLHRASPYLRFLPPELTNYSLLAAAQQQPITSLIAIAGCALYAAAFLAIFTLRMRTEFRGENLTDAANAPSKKKKYPHKLWHLDRRRRTLPPQWRDPQLRPVPSASLPLSLRSSARNSSSSAATRVCSLRSSCQWPSPSSSASSGRRAAQARGYSLPPSPIR
jgi:ABC-2 type transport system permease protein